MRVQFQHSIKSQISVRNLIFKFRINKVEFYMLHNIIMIKFIIINLVFIFGSFIMKKLSLIIPCYNCEKTINRCLESVFCQTYSNLEIIAVNDGSKDNTQNILEDYAKNHSNLIVLNKPNGGVSSARNLALKHITGDYVEFLDSDDNFLSNTVLETLVKTLETNNVDMVVFNFTHPCFESHISSGLYDMQNKNDLKKYYQDFFACSLPWNRLIKREAIKTQFDETMNFAEDEIFNLENLINIKSVYYISDVLYNYYCAPVVNKLNASLVNSLFVSDEFWKNKNTIWYKSINNMEKRKPVFEKSYSDEINDFTFVRPFDFFFYDFAFMNHLNVDVNLQKIQCETILNTPIFKEILNSLENYGLKLKNKNNLALLNNMKLFVELGSYAFKDIKTNGLDLKLYIVLFSIFGKCFFNITENLNCSNLLAQTQFDLKFLNTIEAKYVNYLINSEEQVYFETESLRA